MSTSANAGRNHNGPPNQADDRATNALFIELGGPLTRRERWVWPYCGPEFGSPAMGSQRGKNRPLSERLLTEPKGQVKKVFPMGRNANSYEGDDNGATEGVRVPSQRNSKYRASVI